MQWLSGRESDSWSEGRGFESRPSGHFDSPTGQLVAAPWNPRLISVETGIIIVPNRFEQGATVDKAGYKIWILLLFINARLSGILECIVY